MRRILWVVSFLFVFPFAGGQGNALAELPWNRDHCQVPSDFSSNRPNLGKGPTEVEVGVTILDITQIKSSDQSFHADYYSTFRWNDPRLSEKSLGYSLEGCHFEKNELWHPIAVRMNKRDIKIGYSDFGRVDKEGNVLVLQRVTGTFSAKYFLKNFPFDIQTLPIKVGFTRYSTDEVKYTVSDELSGFFEPVTLPGWDIKQGPMEIIQIKSKREGSAGYPMLVHSVIAERQIGYYVWKVFVPLTLIVFMAWTVFFINPEHFGPQLGLSTASAFTLIAFMISLGRLLPEANYLTKLDEFILGATLMVFGCLGTAVMASRIAGKGDVEKAKLIEKRARNIYPFIFIALILVTLVF